MERRPQDEDMTDVAEEVEKATDDLTDKDKRQTGTTEENQPGNPPTGTDTPAQP